MTVRVFAPAKVNLTLHVTGQRDDGYHLLDSLVVFAPVGDWLEISDYEVSSLTVEGPEADGVPADMSNLALRAAGIVAPDRSVSINLKKHLPVASGIGGGSADAAAVVRGMMGDWYDEAEADRVIGMGDEDFEVRFRPIFDELLALGADIPMCLLPWPQRVGGIGESFKPVDLPPLPALLVNPRISVSTPAVFRALGKKENARMPDELPEFEDAVDFCEWLSEQRNDLEEPAKKICPEIGQVLDVLRKQKGALLARMSGSGATCFVVFGTPEEAQAIGRQLHDDHPDWWITGGLLGDLSEESEPQTS